MGLQRSILGFWVPMTSSVSSSATTGTTWWKWHWRAILKSLSMVLMTFFHSSLIREGHGQVNNWRSALHCLEGKCWKQQGPGRVMLCVCDGWWATRTRPRQMFPFKRGAIFHSIDSAIHQIVIHFCVIMATTKKRFIHLYRSISHFGLVDLKKAIVNNE